jgi:multidrug efflux system outer membrane protein
MAGSDRRKPLRSIFGIVMAVTVAGCSVGPSYNGPVFPFISSYKSGPTGIPTLLDNASWWKKFNDPVLDDLVEVALKGNLDLAVAKERVIEAQALAGTVQSPASITGDVSAGRRDGRNVPGRNGAEASLGLSWLFDPYGGRAAQVRGAEGRVEVADAELDAARLLLLSGISIAYIDMRFSQRSLQLRREELRSRRQTLDLVQKLQAGNAGTRLDVIRAEALVSETQSLIPGIEAAIRVQQNRIAVLLGRQPGSPKSSLRGGGRGQPLARMPSDIGIPADLVRNRPDIRISERLYYVAVADIGAEQAKLYPTLSLGGLVTLSAYGGVKGADYFFGPTLRLPALPNGPQYAEVRVRESRARQALTGWQSSTLEALEQVENALVEYSGSQASVSSARKTVRLYRESVTLTRKLISQDGATVRDLLDAEQSVAVANILLSQNLRQLGRDFVILNVSLGSGNGYEGSRELGTESHPE